ncbi:Hypothetical predicted protein [Mytilus galloprovincialis]|uniref:Ig-like domain-containing protein n=1 Tax=Mytilus galloprovincialis TaxID=29158 RepID=A0A8B6FYE6_MYTGA|nr:Hypothetical predicted protein [Mytilus galloprovincialis]
MHSPLYITDIIAVNISINQNVSGLVGQNSTHLTCSFTKDVDKKILNVMIVTKNRDGNFDTKTPLVIFPKDNASIFHPSGVYLSGRVTLTNMTHVASDVTMTFKKLKCEDEKDYICTITYSDNYFITSTEKSDQSRIIIKDEFVIKVENFYSRKMSNSANNTNNTNENLEVNQTNDKNNMADTIETYSSILQKQNTKNNYDVEDVKPVFILETDLFGNTKPSRDQFLTQVELYKTIDATNCPASHPKGLQRVRGLWRIYFDSEIDRESLLTSGITIRNKYIQVYSRNPRIIVNERPIYLKIRDKNVPCSAEDGQIERS